MLDDARWNHAARIAIFLWIVFAVRLMIADVWDETNGMLAFSSAAMTLTAKWKFVLTQSLGFWRPLPTLIVATVLHAFPDFNVSWRILRVLNIALLLGAVSFLLSAIDAKGFLRFVMTVALLFSGSAVIVAGWYANIFDASSLFLIAIAIRLLFRGRDVAAGVILGIAFFCKETTALALPFLVMLFAAERITFRQLLRSAIPASILGAIYFALRAKIVPFGAAGDIHQFVLSELPPTVINLASSFWFQTMKSSALGIIGVIIFVASLIALKRVRVIAAALAFFGATAVIYWGMFSLWQDGQLIHHLNFIGRLFLIPAALMLVLFAIEKRTIAIALLCIPILFGGIATWRDHARFQRMYKRLYRTAEQATQKPLIVHYPEKPLDDTVRGIKVGDYPTATMKVNARNGRFEYR